MADEVKKAKKKHGFNPAIIIWILVIIFAIAAVGSSFYVVDETEQAVITRLGRYTTTTWCSNDF